MTNTVDVSLNLVDNAWKIDPSDTVVNAMMGGLMDSFSLLDESFDTANTVEAPVEPARVNPATLGDYTVEIKSCHNHAGLCRKSCRGHRLLMDQSKQ